MCVCVWHKSLRFLLGESHGASDRVVLDAGWDAREKGGSFRSNVVIVLIDGLTLLGPRTPCGALCPVVFPFLRSPGHMSLGWW